MPTRVIREGWIESERINQLDANEERFFLRLCLRADDFGRFHANPLLLRSSLFPLHENIRSTDIPRWLAACERAGLVRCFEAHGKRFVEIPRFNQRMRAAVSRFPQPPDNPPQVSDRCPSSDGTSPSVASTSPPESESEAEGESDHDPSALPKDHDVGEIYKEYPRKQSRITALKAIRNALKFCDQERLMERTKAYGAAVREWPKSERKYIPHPATWFNSGGYDDDPATWVRNGSSTELQFDRGGSPNLRV